jgi:hypothetical protein
MSCIKLTESKDVILLIGFLALLAAVLWFNKQLSTYTRQVRKLIHSFHNK